MSIWNTKPLAVTQRINKMNVYLLTDVYGNAWGTIAASDEFEAVELLLDDVESRPDAYLGTPTKILVEPMH